MSLGLIYEIRLALVVVRCAGTRITFSPRTHHQFWTGSNAEQILSADCRKSFMRFVIACDYSFRYPTVINHGTRYELICVFIDHHGLSRHRIRSLDFIDIFIKMRFAQFALRHVFCEIAQNYLRYRELFSY